MDWIIIGALIAVGMYLAPIAITLVLAVVVGIGSFISSLFK